MTLSSEPQEALWLCPGCHRPCSVEGMCQTCGIFALRYESMPDHFEGDNHEYELICKVCDQPGVIRLTIDPQHDMEAHLEYEALAARLAEAEAAVVTARERAEALEGAAELGDAWAEAEAAIGPQFKDLTLRQQYDGRYLAGSAVRQGHGGISGPTPAAALRALAAALTRADQ